MRFRYVSPLIQRKISWTMWRSEIDLILRGGSAYINRAYDASLEKLSYPAVPISFLHLFIAVRTFVAKCPLKRFRDPCEQTFDWIRTATGREGYQAIRKIAALPHLDRSHSPSLGSAANLPSASCRASYSGSEPCVSCRRRSSAFSVRENDETCSSRSAAFSGSILSYRRSIGSSTCASTAIPR